MKKLDWNQIMRLMWRTPLWWDNHAHKIRVTGQFQLAIRKELT